ncbi:hypothetical protein GCM10011312_26790 [Planktosalinus lacus]|uniref:Uncharacterized protein n=2 Tax=Planktosalinus lacus TaxID=1526573 RepID=A0A8J2Y8E6_9FLAO|nr:hypothetical protein GCM10011312_26790 [Planktosalinus lacus]
MILSCKRDLTKDGILMAEREAPIGFNHLRVFRDSTFEFEYKSFPNSKLHTGKIRIQNDTIIFKYDDSIPAFGYKAIIDGKKLIYTNGNYNEILEIWLDSISD